MRSLVPALRDLGEMLNGRSVAPIELFEAAREGLSMIAASGPDMAAWDAQARHGKPESFNTDQGSRFTGVLIENAIAIIMAGKGAWRDNVFVERLWRCVKYEEVYLRAYDSVGDARASIGRYLDFYNRRRPHSSPHSSLDGTTPYQAYFTPLPLRLAA